MARAIAAIVSFVEEPSIGGPGSRHMPLPLLISTLNMEKDSLPDIGLAPRALLLHALEHPSQDRRLVPHTPLSEWLDVSGPCSVVGVMRQFCCLATQCSLASRTIMDV